MRRKQTTLRFGFLRNPQECLPYIIIISINDVVLCIVYNMIRITVCISHIRIAWTILWRPTFLYILLIFLDRERIQTMVCPRQLLERFAVAVVLAVQLCFFFVLVHVHVLVYATILSTPVSSHSVSFVRSSFLLLLLFVSCNYNLCCHYSFLVSFRCFVFARLASPSFRWFAISTQLN